MGVETVTKKTRGWEKRLIAYLRECATQPFRPGRLDCGLFFGGAYEAMTGVVIDKPFRGKYRTIEGAMKIAAKLGFADHVEYVASLLDERDTVLHAQRGDGAVVTDMDGNPALGVVQGEMIYVMGLQGIGLVPLTTATRAFII